MVENSEEHKYDEEKLPHIWELKKSEIQCKIKSIKALQPMNIIDRIEQSAIFVSNSIENMTESVAAFINQHKQGVEQDIVFKKHTQSEVNTMARRIEISYVCIQCLCHLLTIQRCIVAMFFKNET